MRAGSGTPCCARLPRQPIIRTRAASAGRTLIPIVRIELLESRSLAQKRELARVVTDAVCNIAHTAPEGRLMPSVRTGIPLPAGRGSGPRRAGSRKRRGRRRAVAGPSA